MEPTVFDYIDSILYKKPLRKTDIDYSSNYNIYLINRWLSMYSPDLCNIVNSTVNTFGKYLSKQEHYNLLYNLIGKCSKKKINYIKKAKQNSKDDLESINEIADMLEISPREAKELIDLEIYLNK
jgi:hypothetical protein